MGVVVAAPDGHAGALVEREAPVAGGLPAGGDRALAGAGDVVEHDRGAGHQTLPERRQCGRSARLVSGSVGGRTVDEQQVALVGEPAQGRRRVPRRLALERRVHDAGDVVQRLAPRLLVPERSPVAVVFERERRPVPRSRGSRVSATVLTPLPHSRVRVRARWTISLQTATRAAGRIEPVLQGQMAAAVEQRAQDLLGVQVLLAPAGGGRRAHDATAWQSSS